MAKIVGEVAIDVTADIGPLVRQMKRGEGAMDGLRGAANKAARGLQSFGDKAERLGKTMSIVSAAIGAVAGGAFLLAKGTAESAKEIQLLSRLSNASTDEFQRMAAGARSVGIEQDKLADILKDVNDRVGDFNATGGGPMADFFENIAPKVGITADAFKDLSGPEALQLYVSSLQKAGLNQQDMTFYMEAMASDATALIPLLANNGAEMTRLGNAAAKAGGVMDATAIASAGEFNAALTNLQTAFQGIKDKFAATLMPVFTDIMNGITENVLPYIGQAVEKIGEWVSAFENLDPAVQGAVGAVVAAFAAGGPVLLAIGATLKGLGLIVGFLTPVGGIAVALTAGIVIWAKWGDEITAILDGLVSKLDDFKTKALEAVGLGDRIGNINSGMQFGNVAGGGGGIGGIVGGLAGGIAGALRGPDGAAAGADVADGFVNGFQGQMINRIPDIDSAARIAEEVTRLATETNSPSKVFHRLGTYLGDGLANGITESTAMVGAAAANMGQIAVQQADASVGGILNSMGQLFQGSKKISAGIALANSWLAFTEVLKDPSFIGRPFARFAAAASALSAGLNAVRSIKSATPGGGGAGGAGGASAPAAPPQSAANITLVGDTFSRGSIEDLFSQINDGLRQGRIINLVRA